MSYSYHEAHGPSKWDLKSPTKITLEQFNQFYQIECDRSDITIREILDMFKQMVLELGYQELSWNETIKSIYNESKG